MKTILRSATFCLVTLFTAVGAQAATPANVTYGTFGLQFTNSFLGTNQADGIKTTYINSDVPSTSPMAQFQVEGGVADLSTGGSEVQSVGGVIFHSGSEKIELERLALESTGTSEARITALVIVNGQYVGRKAVFRVTSGSFSSPLQYGQNSASNIDFKVTDEFLKDVHDFFPNATIQRGVIGSITLNLVLTPKS